MGKEVDTAAVNREFTGNGRSNDMVAFFESELFPDEENLKYHHDYLNGIVTQYKSKDNGQQDVVIIDPKTRNFTNDATEGVYDYYIDRFHPNWNHQMMAQHYRNVIIEVLKQYDSSFSNEEYNAVSWVGLIGEGTLNQATGLPDNPTAAWQNLTQAERLQILNTYKNFKSNNPPCQ